MIYPKRIRLSRRKGWRLPEGTINVSRPGPWGNAFVVGKDGDAETCVYLHKMLLAGLFNITAKADQETQRRAYRHASKHIPDLEGHDLACWCKLDAWCHGDTLLALANGPRAITEDERHHLRRIEAHGDDGLEALYWRKNPLTVGLVRAAMIWPVDQPDGDTARLTLSTIGERALERDTA